MDKEHLKTYMDQEIVLLLEEGMVLAGKLIYESIRFEPGSSETFPFLHDAYMTVPEEQDVDRVFSNFVHGSYHEDRSPWFNSKREKTPLGLSLEHIKLVQKIEPLEEKLE